MNVIQTRAAIKKFLGKEVYQDSFYWDHNDSFSFMHAAEGRESFMTCESEYRDPIFVLCSESSAFQRRMTGEIKDDWLSKETFGKIASLCCDVLTYISEIDEKFGPWQTDLLNTFKSFI